jgi:hypothetical protein
LCSLEVKNQQLGEKAFPDQKWLPSVTTGRYTSFKIRVVVHNSSARTNVLVIHEDKTISEGVGYEFLKPMLERYDNFKRCTCKVQVELARLWSTKGNMGAAFEARKLVLNTVNRGASIEQEFQSTAEEREALLASLM